MEFVTSQLSLALNLSYLAGLDESGPPTGCGGTSEACQGPLAAACLSSSLGSVPGKYGAQDFPPGDTFISSIATWASKSPASAMAFSLVLGCVAYKAALRLARCRKGSRNRLGRLLRVRQVVLPVGFILLSSSLLWYRSFSFNHPRSAFTSAGMLVLDLAHYAVAGLLKSCGFSRLLLMVAYSVHAVWVVSTTMTALAYFGELTGAELSGLSGFKFTFSVFVSVVYAHFIGLWVYRAGYRLARSDQQGKKHMVSKIVNGPVQDSASSVRHWGADPCLGYENEICAIPFDEEDAHAIYASFFTPETSVLDDVGTPLCIDAFPSPTTCVNNDLEDNKVHPLAEVASADSLNDGISEEQSRLGSEDESFKTASVGEETVEWDGHFLTASNSGLDGVEISIIDAVLSPTSCKDDQEQESSIEDLVDGPVFEEQLHLDEDFKNVNDVFGDEVQHESEEALWIGSVDGGVSQEHYCLSPEEKSCKSSLIEENITVALDGHAFSPSAEDLDDDVDLLIVDAAVSTVPYEDDGGENLKTDFLNERIAIEKDIEDNWPIYCVPENLEQAKVDILVERAEDGASNVAYTDSSDGGVRESSRLSLEDENIKIEEKAVALNGHSLTRSTSGLDVTERRTVVDVAVSSIPCEKDLYKDQVTNAPDAGMMLELLKDLQAKIAHLEAENAKLKDDASRARYSTAISSSAVEVDALPETQVQPVEETQESPIVPSQVEQVSPPVSENDLKLSDISRIQEDTAVPSQVEPFASPASEGGPELGNTSPSEEIPAMPSQVEDVAFPAPEDDLKLGDTSRDPEGPALCNFVDQTSSFRLASEGGPELDDVNRRQDCSAMSNSASGLESCPPSHEEDLEHTDASPAPANTIAFNNIVLQVKSCPSAFEDHYEPTNTNPTPITSLPPCDLAEVHPSPLVIEDGPSHSSCVPPMDTEDEYRSVTEIKYASCFAGEVRAIFVSDGVYGRSEPAGWWTQQSVCLDSNVTEERNKLLQQDRHVVEAIRADEQVCNGTGPVTGKRNGQDGISAAYEEWNDLLEQAGLIPKATTIDEWDSDERDSDAYESNTLLEQSGVISQAARTEGQDDSDGNGKTESSIVMKLREDLELCEGRLRLCQVAFDWCVKDRSRFKRELDDLSFLHKVTKETLIAEIRKYQDKVATVERSDLASAHALEAAEETIDFLEAENYFAQVASEERVHRLQADNAALVAELRAWKHRAELFESESDGTQNGSGDLDCDDEYPAGTLEDCQARLALCQAALSWQEDNRRRYKAKNEGLNRVKKQDKLTKQAFTEEVQKQIAKNVSLERDKRIAARSLEAAEDSIDFLQAESFFERQAFQKRILELEEGLVGKEKDIGRLQEDLAASERRGHSHELNAAAHAQWNAVLVKGKRDAESASQQALDSVNADLRSQTAEFERKVDTLVQQVVSLTKDNKSVKKELKKTKADLDAIREREKSWSFVVNAEQKRTRSDKSDSQATVSGVVKYSYGSPEPAPSASASATSISQDSVKRVHATKSGDGT